MPKKNANRTGGLTRRGFLGKGLAAGALFYIVPRHVLGGPGYTPPSEVITRAVIGTGGMGIAGHVTENVEGRPPETLAVCDVDETHLAEALKKAGRSCDGYHDWREVLERKDIDTIHIATPPHWHALMAIAAAQCGFDILGEKPMSHTIYEGRKMVETIERYGRIFKVNTFFRYGTYYQYGSSKLLKKLVDSGLLGKPLTVRVSRQNGFDWKLGMWSGQPNLKPEPVPTRLNYDMWLGPAQTKPYHPHRVHQSFRGYWDYDGGGLTDMGQHYLDPVQYFLGKDDTSPVEVSAVAPWPSHPDAVGLWERVTMKYADGDTVHLVSGEWGQDDPPGLPFIEGPKGKVYGNYRTDPPELFEQVKRLPDPPEQLDFEEAVRTRRKSCINESIAHRSCTLLNLAAIAIRLGRPLKFDPVAEQFVGDEQANRLVRVPMRSPWHLQSGASVMRMTMMKRRKGSGFGVQGSVKKAPRQRGNKATRGAWASGPYLCYFVTLLLCYSVSTAFAQQSPSPAVEQVLSRTEFNGNATPASLGPDLLKLSEPELTELCDLVVEPGTGDDTKARMALQALTFYLSQEGTPDDRGRFIGVLCKALKAEKPAEVKKFLIERLQLAGDDQAVETLASFVLDPELGPFAAEALLAIGSPAAADALRMKYNETATEQTAQLLGFVMQADKGEQTVMDATLALIALPRKEGYPSEQLYYDALCLSHQESTDLAVESLETEDAVGGSFDQQKWWESSQWSKNNLGFGDELALRGQVEDSVQVYRQILRTYTSPETVHVRCAALYGLAQAAPREAVHDIVNALADENPELRAAAMELGVKLEGAESSRAIAEELARSLPPTAMGILEVLGRRHDPSVLSFALDALGDDHKDVRIAAIRAAAAIDGAAALGPLADRLVCDDDEERSAAEDMLVGLRYEAASARLADGLADAPARMKCSILHILTRRHATDKLGVIVKYMRHEDPSVRLAAIQSVGELAEDVPSVQRLIQLLGEVETAEAREATEQALVAVCLRCPDKDAAIDVVLDKLDPKQTVVYGSLLRALGKLPGRPAFAALEAALHVDNAEIRAAAIRGMSDRPDPTLHDAAVLLETARGFDELTEHVLTMRAFANFVGRCTDESAAERLALFDAGLAAARRDEERKLLLSKIADVAAHETIEYLDDYLKTPNALTDETASGLLRVAGNLLPHDWQLATEVVDQVKTLKVADAARKRAEQLAERIDASQGYVIDWLVAGPYATEGKAGHDMLDDVFAPENPADTTVEWKAQPRTPDKGDFWHIDFLRSGGRDNSAMYLRTYLWSPTARPALLELGSDDGLKVWLNGAVIHANKILRGCGPAQDKVAAELRAGWNEILLKVTNGDGGFGACLRVRAPEGGQIDGLKVNPDPEMEKSSPDDEAEENETESD